jgi:site-specific DNA-methyltransferase (adenine-specific)
MVMNKSVISETHNMDCIEYMRSFPDNHFELAIVDPPYGINEKGSRNLTGDRPNAKWRNPNSQHYKAFDDSKIPSSEYFKELFRISKMQVIWGGIYFTEHLYTSTGWLIWNKKVNEKEHLSMCEMAWTSFNRRVLMYEYLWAGFRKKHQIERIHPTQKPVDLYKWVIEKCAKPGDKIFDSHLGSGSSRIAAYDMGFDFYATELDADYFRDQEKRFKEFKSQLKMFAA